MCYFGSMNACKRTFHLAILALLSIALQSCSFGNQVSSSTAGRELNPARLEIVEGAREALGARYAYGATGSKRYDCSGLVFSLYTAQEIDLPRSTREMAEYGEKIRKEELKPGDLVFFRNVRKIDHVAIVSRLSASKTWLIHSTTSRGVIEEVLEESPYWNQRIDQYRRFFK